MQSIYQHLDDDEPPAPQNEGSSLPPPGKQPLTALQLAEWRWANVDNMDLFLQNVYEYYNNRGFYCILLARALQMATIAFVVWFSTYIYSCIDYTQLRHATSFSEARVPRCIARISWFHYLSLWLFSAVWMLKLFQYIGDIRNLWEMHEFYYHLLHISENEIQTISWQQVVDRIVHSKSINGALSRKIDVHEIVNRIMRKENYMIAIYNKNVFDLEIEIPFGFGKSEFLTKIMEWSIFLCLDDYIFNERNHVRSIVLKESKRDILAQGLRRRIQFAALMNVLFAPVAIIYTTLYYFFKYFNEFYKTPKKLGSRQYTPLAEWRFRELNELYHLFRRRISMSELPAQRYISQFPRYKTELVLKFVIFVLSSFAAVLLVLSVYDRDILSLELKLYLASLGVAIMIARAMLPEPLEQAIYDPDTSMRQIIEFTHYMPDSWEGRLHTEPVKNEFCALYDLKPKIIAREILSVVLNPIILWFKLAQRSERIVDFFREFSVKVDELGGYVCTFAVFNTDRVSKVKERSDALDNFYATQDGKVLKSYLNFMDVYGAPPNHRGTYTSRDPTTYGDQYAAPAPFYTHTFADTPSIQSQYESSKLSGSPTRRSNHLESHPGQHQLAGKQPDTSTNTRPLVNKYSSSFDRKTSSSSSSNGSQQKVASQPNTPTAGPSNLDVSSSSTTNPQSPASNSGVPPIPQLSMEASVMYNYEQLRQHDMHTIQEEQNTISTADSNYTNEDEDDRFAKDGVIGLLNNLYKK